MPRARDPNKPRRRCIAACTNCKRRKEKCDGQVPCGRCIQRCVTSQCTATKTGQRGPLPASLPAPAVEDFPAGSVPTTIDDSSNLERNWTPLTEESDLRGEGDIGAYDSEGNDDTASCRLLQASKGKHMYIGDSANLSFLQRLRQLVQNVYGTCAFVEDPYQSFMVEPSTARDTLDTTPISLKDSEMSYYAHWYTASTSGVLHLFESTDKVLEAVQQWHWNEHEDDIETIADASNTIDTTSSKAVIYLLLAIGAQTCPDDRDQECLGLFRRGQKLALSCLDEDPSLTSVHATLLLAYYLLGASRRNAAFVHLGMATQSAYCLGLHLQSVSELFGDIESSSRERTWKSIRMLDIYMSASLGRPMTTSETRSTSSKAEYSASLDLCMIFETIHSEVYSKRMINPEVFNSITIRHRRWAAHLYQGLKTDGIVPSENMSDGTQNLGLLHLKASYYWSIVLLCRPFLVEHVSDSTRTGSGTSSSATCTPRGKGSPSWTEDMAEACIYSAMSLAKLLKSLCDHPRIPKRLPLIINAAFGAVLVLGYAHFTSFGMTLSLSQSAKDIRDVLALFAGDEVGKRFLTITQDLIDTCQAHEDRQKFRAATRSERLVVSIFGQLDDRNPSQRPARYSPLDHWTPRTSTAVGNNTLDMNGSGETSNVVNGVQFDRPASTALMAESSLSSTHAGTNVDTSFLDTDFDFAWNSPSAQPLHFSSIDDHAPMFRVLRGTMWDQ